MKKYSLYQSNVKQLQKHEIMSINLLFNRNEFVNFEIIQLLAINQVINLNIISHFGCNEK